MVSHRTLSIVSSNMNEPNGSVKDSPSLANTCQTAKQDMKMNSCSGFTCTLIESDIKKSSTHAEKVHATNDLKTAEMAAMMSIGMASRLGLMDAALMYVDSSGTHGKDTTTIKAARRIAETKPSTCETPGTARHFLQTRPVKFPETECTKFTEKETTSRVWYAESP